MASGSSSSSFSPSSSSSLLVSSHDHERPNIESIRAVVATINQHICEFVEDTETRKSVKLKCTSKLEIPKRAFFDFSEQSILSNLYWGIESIEAAIQAKWPEEKSCKLKDSARMLQVPALFSEHGVTAGIPNHYLVCCSYFYLSVVQKLQGDDWQVALHFLHAVLVSPKLVQTQFIPKLCNSLFHSCMTYERTEMGAGRGLKSPFLMDFDEDGSSEAMRYVARRCKAWLTYYQVMSYGETPWWHSGRKDTASVDELQSST